MAATTFFDFLNCKIFWAIGVEMVETHQHAKFRQNRSIDCEDIKIFQDGGHCHLGLLNSQNFIGRRCL